MSLSKWWPESQPSLKQLLTTLGIECEEEVPRWMIISGLVAGIGLVSAGYLYMRPAIILRTMTQFTVKSGGFKVKTVRGTYTYSYMERGSRKADKASLLFVDGNGGQKESWLDLCKLIPPEVHIICVDLPSQGDTEIPADLNDATPYRLTDFLEEIVNLTEMNKQPFHLVGHSLGGLIAGLYTASHPERVTKTTLSCPAVLCPIETEIMHQLMNDDEFILDNLDQKSPEELKDFFASMVHNPKNIPQQLWIYRGMLQMIKEQTPMKKKFLNAVKEGMKKTFQEKEKIEDILGKISTPVQIIWGVNDMVLHVSGASYLEDVIATISRTDIIPECGHDIYVDNIPALSSHIMDFHATNIQSTVL